MTPCTCAWRNESAEGACGRVARRLEAAGAGAPDGRSYHVALEVDGKINVFDVWESQEAFDAFGATLMPILTELGVDPGAPAVMAVHNMIVG